MRILTILVALLIVSLVGFVLYSTKFVNPRVAQELRDNPGGSKAERVMLMTIGDRKTIPVNYLREDDLVFIGADGPWWREMQGAGQPVVMLIKGEILGGRARAIVDRPDYTCDVFKRLRPDVPKWLPVWLRGVLVEIELASEAEGSAAGSQAGTGIGASERVKELMKDVVNVNPNGSGEERDLKTGSGSLLEELNQRLPETDDSEIPSIRTRELAEKIFEEVNE